VPPRGLWTTEDLVQGDTYSFVVRIWHEALDSEGHITAWRGSIDHVGSGERIHFDNLDQIAQFIRERVGLEGQRPRLSKKSD
jgi:hypothetical protein